MNGKVIEHKVVGKYSFVIVRVTPFDKWLSYYHGNPDKLMRLNKKDREKIFLRWKWGFTDERANESLEFSERALLRQHENQNLSEFPEGLRYYIENKLAFNNICQEIKSRLGLDYNREEKIDPLVDSVVEAFNGQDVQIVQRGGINE